MYRGSCCALTLARDRQIAIAVKWLSGTMIVSIVLFSCSYVDVGSTDDPLTVSEVGELSVGTVAVIRGYLLQTGNDVRLCDDLTPATQPLQCFGSGVFISGVDVGTFPASLVESRETTAAGMVVWTEEPILVTAEVLNEGVLEVRALGGSG